MLDENKRAPLLCALLDGAVAVCALVGFTVCFLSLYGSTASFVSGSAAAALHANAARLGYFVAASALFAAAGAAVWALPRFSSAAAGGLGLLWSGLIWYNLPHVRNGAVPVVRPVAASLGQCMGMGWEIAYRSRYSAAQNRQDVRLFLLLALAGLALALGWAVVRARSWWAAVLFTLPPLLPAMLLGVYPPMPALVALAAAWCALLLGGLCRAGGPALRARLTGVSLLCSALLLSVLLAALPREGYTRPAWALALNEKLMDFGRSFTNADNPSPLPAPTGTIRAGSAGQADLSHAGPLRFSGRTMLRVRTDYGGRLYLRGASLAFYSEGIWEPVPETAYMDLSLPVSNEGKPVSALLFPAAFGQHQEEYSAEIEDVGTGGGRVYVPYHPLLQDWDAAGVIPIDDAYFARQGLGRTNTIRFSPQVLPHQYVTQQILGDNGYYGFVQDHYYHGVPAAVFDALESVPEIQAFLSGLYTNDYLQCANDTAAFLADRCEYDPQTPAAPDGEDPVIYFLTESKRGYCMHFASAAALLLRMVGIPTRYVSGYVADCVPGERVNVPDRAAHAWIEVWLDTLGWYPVEVTPAAAMELYTTGTLPSESSSSESTPSSSSASSTAETPASSSRADATPSAISPADLAAFRAIGRLLLWAASLFALLWLGQALPKRLRARRLADKNVNRATLYAYRCLRRLSRWGGRVPPQAIELAQKARFSRHTLTPSEIAFLRGLVDQQRACLCAALPQPWAIIFRYLWGAGPLKNVYKREI